MVSRLTAFSTCIPACDHMGLEGQSGSGTTWAGRLSGSDSGGKKWWKLELLNLHTCFLTYPLCLILNWIKIRKQLGKQISEKLNQNNFSQRKNILIFADVKKYLDLCSQLSFGLSGSPLNEGNQPQARMTGEGTRSVSSEDFISQKQQGWTQ